MSVRMETGFSPWKFFDLFTTGSLSQIVIPAAPNVIPGTGSELEIICSVRGDQAAVNVGMTLLLNNDATLGHYFDEINAQTGTATAAPVEDVGTASFRFGNISAANATAGSFSRVQFRIGDYASTTKMKPMFATLSRLDTAVTGGDAVGVTAAWWNQLVAVTSIQINLALGAFVNGSHIVGYIWP